ncbi:class I SAM-dependent methyltransferase [Trichlorobacter sp.]|uniref:class I SAM-dependent methyltransferase n=1 Tax=Trichlorobacter sp. TaxID=2911007 RepID=UPI002A35CECE|nr:methyltransferase domain-containing protein [Trichlorobacter sp.]MDY0384737.1 methyltransferase domain-containing protein [Trichlorobacter sp.]
MPNEFYQKLQKGNVHVVYDLCSLQPLPFESGSVAIFYTSHTIEHLPNDKVRHLFAEIHRCLKVGGIFRVTCPDMEIQYRAYQNRDEHFWSQPSPWLTNLSALENRFIEHFATALTAHHCVKIKGTPFAPISPQELEALFSTHSMEDFFDTIISRIPPDSNSWFPEGHCNWFTPSKVLMMLKKSGFAAVYQSGYGQSADPRLRNTDLFDSTCPELSLYAEAVK